MAVPVHGVRLYGNAATLPADVVPPARRVWWVKRIRNRVSSTVVLHPSNNQKRDTLYRVLQKDQKTTVQGVNLNSVAVFRNSVSRIKAQAQDSVNRDLVVQHSFQYQDQARASDKSTSQSDCKLFISRSIISLDISFRQDIYQGIQSDYFYATILYELEDSEMRDIVRNNYKYKIKNQVLYINQANQLNELEYWRIVVHDHNEIKTQIWNECHSVPYLHHPGVQRTLQRVRQKFFWKGQTGDVRVFVKSCPIYQTQKTDHTLTRGKREPKEQ